ncbi:MAG TPA: OsmC family protein [Accumulibacter sp.]|nr:OsmC family protein [Accumulibacter sp.]HMW18217.1 OsmC family protein [Accumulibacter sp.]HMX22847.1 OsmC family protein [Accumulibacter sp.]HMY05858.1 OsmC family protein [Accumulibacter sp.]HNC18350.1 OsmC family protein [Accumulibacter sp.]
MPSNPVTADAAPVIVSGNGQGRYQQAVHIGKHHLLVDEPVSLGGDDAAPAPTDFLLAALGACTSITLQMYAERKQMPLTGVQVALTLDKIEKADGGKMDRISRKITLDGELTDAQRAALLAIANKCPVHRLLQSDIRIDSELVDAGGLSSAV